MNLEDFYSMNVDPCVQGLVIITEHHLGTWWRIVISLVWQDASVPLIKLYTMDDASARLTVLIRMYESEWF